MITEEELSDIQKIFQEINEIRGNMKKKDERITDLQEELHDRSREIADIMSDIKELKVEIGELRKVVQRRDKERNKINDDANISVRSKETQDEDTGKSNNKAVTFSKNENNKPVKNKVKFQDSRDRSLHSTKILHQETQDFKVDKKEWVEQYSDMRQEIDSLKKVMTELKREIEKQVHESSSSESLEIRGLKKEIYHGCETNDWRQSIALLEDHFVKDSSEYKQLKNIKGSVHLPWYAAQKGYIELIKVLLFNGLPINKGYSRSNSKMLHEAAEHGHCDLVKFLIKHGAHVDVRDVSSRTPLQRASMRKYLEIMEILICNGSDINNRDIYGFTALHHAAWDGEGAVVKCLLTNECDKTVLNKHGKTALYYAKENEHEEIIKLLSNKSTNISNTLHNIQSIILCRKM